MSESKELTREEFIQRLIAAGRTADEAAHFVRCLRAIIWGIRQWDAFSADDAQRWTIKMNRGGSPMERSTETDIPTRAEILAALEVCEAQDARLMGLAMTLFPRALRALLERTEDTERLEVILHADSVQITWPGKSLHHDADSSVWVLRCKPDTRREIWNGRAAIDAARKEGK